MSKMTRKGAIALSVVVFVVAALLSAAITYSLTSSAQRRKSAKEVLQVFEELTSESTKLLYDWQKGEYYEFPENVEQCMGAIAADSNQNEYYGLKEKAYKNVYDLYSEDSQYAKDIESTVKRAESMLEVLRRRGVVDAVKSMGMKPSVMYDIDNTLEFSSRKDDDPSGEGPPIRAVVEFAKECRKEGLECYFITARPCDESEARATWKWLKRNLGLSGSEMESHVFLMGKIKFENVPPQVKVAYKDVVREALSRRDKAYWLFSIGDQLTDVYGDHSGIKLLVPNLLFDNSIVSNQYYDPGDTSRKEVVEPSPECYKALGDKVLEETAIGRGIPQSQK
jgi:hypothetical protein